VDADEVVGSSKESFANRLSCLEAKLGEVSGDGTGSSQQFERPYLVKLSSLEQKLEDVKTAYRSKYSYDVDADEVVGSSKESFANRLSCLEAKLGEVESLYCEKYGEDLRDADGEAEEDEDGALWIQVSGDGTGSSQQFEPPYLAKLISLEQMLEDVKTAYRSEYSCDVDVE